MCENNVFSLVLYKGNHFLLTFSCKTYPKVAKLVEISCRTKQFGIFNKRRRVNYYGTRRNCNIGARREYCLRLSKRDNKC